MTLDEVCPARLRGVLHVRGVVLSDEALVAVAARFGTPCPVPARFRAGGHRCVRLQSNVPGVGAVDTGAYWHADGPRADPPVVVTLLVCDEAPVAGGETLFSRQRVPVACDERYGGVAPDPRAVFAHVWTAGDLLVWDNRVMVHRATPCVAGRKVTRRVTVAG